MLQLVRGGQVGLYAGQKMDFFFHHVGGPGSARDFPRTVFATIPLERIASGLGNNPNKQEIIGQLQRAFPSGFCNVWGVPEGAKPVIRKLQVGDAMLLVGSVHWMTAVIPALSIVKVFPRILLLDLSRELWGEAGFPYIFFFDTERIQHNWHQFVEDIDYSSNFNPRGMVYRVNPSRLVQFGGPLGYVEHIRKNYKE